MKEQKKKKNIIPRNRICASLVGMVVETTTHTAGRALARFLPTRLPVCISTLQRTGCSFPTGCFNCSRDVLSLRQTRSDWKGTAIIHSHRDEHSCLQEALDSPSQPRDPGLLLPVQSCEHEARFQIHWPRVIFMGPSFLLLLNILDRSIFAFSSGACCELAVRSGFSATQTMGRNPSRGRNASHPLTVSLLASADLGAQQLKVKHREVAVQERHGKHRERPDE